MKIRLIAIAAVALALPFAAASCSSDSTGNYSVEKISSELQDAGLTKAQADCFAPMLKKADLTEKEIKAASPADPTSKAGKVFAEAATKCVGATGGSTTTTP
jgi:hypothetical protein